MEMEMEIEPGMEMEMEMETERGPELLSPSWSRGLGRRALSRAQSCTRSQSVGK